MAHDARTRPLPGPIAGEPDADVDDGAFVGIDLVLEKLWRLLTSMRFALVLILALAVLGLIGTLVIQAPAGVLADPTAKADWIDQIRPKYGGWTNVMDTLGVFQIFDSIWFRVIAAALVISTTACSLHRIPGMWKTATKPHVGVGEAFFTHAPQRDSVRLDAAPAAALERVAATFRRHHYRTIVEDDGWSMWESNAITRYLAARHAPGTLYPNDLRQRASAERWMDWQLTTLGPAFTPMFHGLVRTPPEKRDAQAIEKSRANTETKLEIMDSYLAKSKFMAGEQFSFGDIVIGIGIVDICFEASRRPRRRGAYLPEAGSSATA